MTKMSTEQVTLQLEKKEKETHQSSIVNYHPTYCELQTVGSKLAQVDTSRAEGGSETGEQRASLLIRRRGPRALTHSTVLPYDKRPPSPPPPPSPPRLHVSGPAAY